MSFLVVTNVVASRPPERRLTGMWTARAKICKKKSCRKNVVAEKILLYVIMAGEQSQFLLHFP